MIYIGIDPGFDGAIGAVGKDGFIGVRDTPSLEVKSGKKTRRKYNTPEMVKIILELTKGYDRVFLALEQVGSMPGQGVASMFAFGRGLGMWEGILACACVTACNGSIHMVRPQKWKAIMLDGMDKGSKASSILKATQLFPMAPISLKKHDGRAEALLIAEWVRQSSSSSELSSLSSEDSVTD